jgi:ABC-type uncharacterized transport system permease subunit
MYFCLHYPSCITVKPQTFIHSTAISITCYGSVFIVFTTLLEFKSQTKTSPVADQWN